jgi:hypothetical protein
VPFLFHLPHYFHRFCFFALAVCVGMLAPWAVMEKLVMAQGLPQVEPPPLVRLTGVLVPIETSPPASGLSTLTVRIGENKYILKIKNFEKLTGQSTTELRLLESIFPPFLRLIGPEPLLVSLQDFSATRKVFSIEGRLYRADRFLLLTDIQAEETSPNHR